MKKLFTLSFLFTGMIVARSQTVPQLIRMPKPEVQALLNRNLTGQTAKTTALKERLQAKMFRSYYANGAPNGADTMHYWYHGNTRGSSFDFNTLEYTSPNPWFVFTSLAVKADSCIELFDDNTGQGMVLYMQTKASYTPAGQPAAVITDLNSQPDHWRSTYTYDAQGHATEVLRETQTSSGPWVYRSHTFFNYNAQGNVLTDSLVNYDTITQSWEPSTRTTYTYDAPGINQLSIFKEVYNGSSFSPSQLLNNSFYPNNRLQTTLLSGFDINGNPVPLVRDSFGYTGNNDYYTYYYEAEPDMNGIFEPVYLQTRHINAQNLPDTINAFYPANGQWIQDYRGYYTYTSYGNPENFAFYNLPASTQNPVGAGRYYYETYDPTAVAGIPAAVQNISLYPTPATDVLHIYWGNATPGATVAIIITDMQGRMVRSESLRWNEPVQQLSLAGMQPGVYNITIGDEKEKQVCSRQMVKQ